MRQETKTIETNQAVTPDWELRSQNVADKTATYYRNNTTVARAIATVTREENSALLMLWAESKEGQGYLLKQAEGIYSAVVAINNRTYQQTPAAVAISAATIHKTPAIWLKGRKIAPGTQHLALAKYWYNKQ